jgi:hypothetical protein
MSDEQYNLELIAETVVNVERKYKRFLISLILTSLVCFAMLTIIIIK